MTLSKHTYVKNWEHMKPEELHEITITKGGKPSAIKTERISTIVETVMYWRKANAIHRWFVNNVQDGEDDCKDYYVNADQLSALLEVCKKVSKNKKLASKLLPTQSGFFFGATEYDKWYFSDIKDTMKKLTELLAEMEKDPHGSFYYHSSW